MHVCEYFLNDSFKINFRLWFNSVALKDFFDSLIQMGDSKGEYYHEIQACISCLGFMENGEYKKEPDVEGKNCVLYQHVIIDKCCFYLHAITDSIKDLLRYLRKEKSDTCYVRREIGRAKIVVSDLIPLLKSYPRDHSLFELVMRLLMNLTQPAIICFRNEVPKDKIRLGYFLELESILREYKLVSFCSIHFIAVFQSHVVFLGRKMFYFFLLLLITIMVYCRIQWYAWSNR